MKKEFEHKRPSRAISGTQVDEEIIRKRAYELYVDRGFENGHDLEDWFRAEEELAARKSQSTAA